MPGEGLDSCLRSSAHLDFWATPSGLPDQMELGWRLDQSVSNLRLGSPIEHNGAFAVLEQLIAEARHAERAWPLANGATSGNQIAMVSLLRHTPTPRVLAAANCHHSVLRAASHYGVSIEFLPGRMLSCFDAMLPPTPAEVALALDEAGDITALWLSSPTYQGLSADIAGIVEVAHARGALVVVDAAWGAHFGFHPDLPPATAQVGPDLIVESTHKTGGGLQGSAVLLLCGNNIDPAIVDGAYASVTSTSQSFLVLASLGVAMERMSTDGKRYLDTALAHARSLECSLLERGVAVLSHPGQDPTKVTFTGLPGFEVQRHLDRRDIVIEMATERGATMLATMGLRRGAADRAVAALDEFMAHTPPQSNPASTVGPAGWLSGPAEVEPHVAIRARVERVPAQASIGRIAADLIELYPPGIPVIGPGWRVTEGAVDALRGARAAGAHLVPADITSIPVLPLR